MGKLLSSPWVLIYGSRGSMDFANYQEILGLSGDQVLKL